MLYLDSSALIKRYVKELGTDATKARIETEAATPGNPFTSVLTYAEIHATLARKKKTSCFPRANLDDCKANLNRIGRLVLAQSRSWLESNYLFETLSQSLP